MGFFGRKKKMEHFEVLTGYDFEYMVAYYFERIGAKKVEVSPSSNDGGKDVVFYQKKRNT